MPAHLIKLTQGTCDSFHLHLIGMNLLLNSSKLVPWSLNCAAVAKAQAVF